MKKNVISLVLLLSFFSIISIYLYPYDCSKEDIHSVYLDGEKIAKFKNPYHKIIGGSMRVNNEYSAYFPGMYLLVGVTYKLFNSEFDTWIQFWKIVNFFAIAFLIMILFKEIYRKSKQLLYSCVILFLTFFNSFSLKVMQIAHIDYLALLFLILSLIKIDKNKTVSLLLFGLSLSVKQIGIFLVPIYLIYYYVDIKSFMKNIFYMSVIPFVISLPFLIVNPIAYLKSVFFSATRYAAGHFGTIPLDTLFNLVGIGAKIFMLSLFVFIFILLGKRKISLYLSVVLVFFTFIGFNSVLFRQYTVWVIIPSTLLFFNGTESFSFGKNKTLKYK